MTSSVSALIWYDVLVEAAMERVGSVAQPPEQRKPLAQRNSHRSTAFIPRLLYQAEDARNKRVRERKNRYLV